ncbi:hypothetical protein DENSPDRAFT_840723 [Dentipellis sp. KUC8613]|nr:hypothetical protein DENSPDRAFT_840723 [Dentipellis sp. KUC8613]
MSSQDFQNFDTTGTNDFSTGTDRPQHFQHNPSEPLPGAPGARQTADYDVDTTEATDGRFDQAPRFENRESDRSDRVQGLQPTYGESNNNDGADAGSYGEDKPQSFQPTRSSGISQRDDDDDLPQGKAGMMDKAIGKAQQVAGKYTHKTELYEKGELREAGGKAAVQGNARVPQD